MKKFATSCALCALLAAAEAADVSLPYGNAGLDYISDKINSADSDLQEQTGVSFFFDYYSVLVSNPYGGAAQGRPLFAGKHEFLLLVNSRAHGGALGLDSDYTDSQPARNSGSACCSRAKAWPRWLMASFCSSASSA